MSRPPCGRRRLPNVHWYQASLLAVLALAVIATPAAGQTTPRYLITPDTLRYDIYNPFRMYWVRGSDTVGVPPLALSGAQRQLLAH